VCDGGSVGESVQVAVIGLVVEVMIARQQSSAARDVVLQVSKSVGAQCVQAEVVVSL
jgi:hypothetical protein